MASKLRHSHQPSDDSDANDLDNLPTLSAPDADLGETLRRELVKTLLLNADNRCPTEMLLALVLQESPAGLDNGAHRDGIMQVTPASGHHEEAGPYDNTAEGIENNVRDGLTVLEDEYMDRFDTSCICAVWMYNGGNNPCATYRRGQGDPQYLGHLADQLENNVASTFGDEFENPDLVRRLRAVQQDVDDDCQSVHAECRG